MKNYYTVFMAGGIGARFAPLSTPENPKQFHDLLGKGKSLLQLTAERFRGFIPSDNLFISTNIRYQELINTQLPDISNNQLLLEPSRRNTAPCILYSALKIYQRNPDAILIISPSDHKIDATENFVQNLATAAEFCMNNDALLTLGIQPDFPCTEYGYIHYSASDNEIKNVIRFTEKPNVEKAREFLKNGNYLWNSGVFIWSVKSILSAFEKYQPEMYALFNSGIDFWNSNEEKKFLADTYSQAENISIDFGILEKANNVYVLPASFDWSDIGSWESLYNVLPKDTNGYAWVADYKLETDSTNNLIVKQFGKEVYKQR